MEKNITPEISQDELDTLLANQEESKPETTKQELPSKLEKPLPKSGGEKILSQEEIDKLLGNIS